MDKSSQKCFEGEKFESGTNQAFVIQIGDWFQFLHFMLLCFGRTSELMLDDDTGERTSRRLIESQGQ